MSRVERVVYYMLFMYTPFVMFFYTIFVPFTTNPILLLTGLALFVIGLAWFIWALPGERKRLLACD